MSQINTLPSIEFSRETDLDEVLQTPHIYSNVSQGQFANKNELDRAFDTQDVLMGNGWLRIDYDSILPKNPKTTRDQRDALRKLIQLDGDDNWRKTCELINLFCFKQTRKKKKAA